MAIKKEKFKNDRALRFYYDVLGLDRLHYGIWEDSDPRTLEGVKIAQKRYEDFLLTEIENVAQKPTNTSILDVGCGSGIMSESLFNKGFQVEGLSPDLFQKEVFEKRISAPFHLARFQNFEPAKHYDIVLMSESAQYIPMKKLFIKANECIGNKGYLMVCDYFTFDSAKGIIAKSGHNLNQFLKIAGENGFELIKQQDITKETIPTLDTAKIFIQKYIIPSIDIFSDKINEKHPRLFRFVKWMLRKKIAKVNNNMEMLDSDKFAKNKCYMYFLFQK